MKSELLLALLFIVSATSITAQPTVNISGGGSGAIAAAITANFTTGANLVIQDSLSYTESANLQVAPRYSPTNGRRGFSITAINGETPTIVLNGCGILAYAGGADAKIGSNTGGRINIDARNGAIGGTNGAIWYIGQEDGIGSAGQACRLTFENVNMDFRGRMEGIVFGAGGNDGSPQLTSATLTLDNCYTRGGAAIVQTLYAPATVPSLTKIVNCQMLEIDDSVNNALALHLGAFQLGGAKQMAQISRTTIHIPDAGNLGFEANGIVVRKGGLVADHINVINEATMPNASAARGILATETGVTTVTNSIVRAVAGTVKLAATTAAGTIVDSNVTSPDGVPNSGFTFTNVVEEWPVFVAVNDNPSDASSFLVQFGTQSATHGATPPIGAKTGVSAGPPTPTKGWEVYQ